MITYVGYDKFADYKNAKTDYVIFIKDFYTPEIDKSLSQVYKDNPQYRKMSMVSPVLSTPSAMIYGFKLGNEYITPQYVPSSTAPYAIQIGPILGSVIRKSALERLGFESSGHIMEDSYLLSLALWDSGNRVYLAPYLMRPGKSYNDNAHKYDGPEYADLRKLFKREMIG